jgi:hypothetical protein
MAVPSSWKKEHSIGDENSDREFNMENERGRALYLPDSESTVMLVTERRKRENLKEKQEKGRWKRERKK